MASSKLLLLRKLKENLKPYGYEAISHINGFWQHHTWQLILFLCINDFSIKYFPDDALRLFTSLQQFL